MSDNIGDFESKEAFEASPLAAKWREEQAALRERMVREDVGWSRPVRLVAGLDVSADVEEPTRAVASCVICEYPSMDVVHEVHHDVTFTQPYASGFLAFREVDFLLDLLAEVRRERPDVVPDVCLVDGNGELHVNGFGLACHLGVRAGIATIGIGKKMHAVDGMGKETIAADVMPELLAAKGKHSVMLTGASGKTWAAAVRGDSSHNPVFVSIGHNVSLQSAVDIVLDTFKYRIPEPVRLADLKSRDILRTRRKAST